MPYRIITPIMPDEHSVVVAPARLGARRLRRDRRRPRLRQGSARAGTNAEGAGAHGVGRHIRRGEFRDRVVRAVLAALSIKTRSTTYVTLQRPSGRCFARST